MEDAEEELDEECALRPLTLAPPAEEDDMLGSGLLVGRTAGGDEEGTVGCTMSAVERVYLNTGT